VIIVGLGSIGRTAATLFRALARPALVVESDPCDDPIVRHLCVLSGNGADTATLEAGGIVSARGFLAATGDDWQNLEMALLARSLNPDCALAICTNERHFSVNVAGIVPQLQVVCVPLVAAKAFAAAALGQTVLDLFQLAGRTVYVVEHRVAHSDGLDGRLLSEIAEGYSVVPVLYESPRGPSRRWSMADRPVSLQEGYRVVLLGPSSSLRRITRAEMHPRTIALELSELRPHADRLLAVSVLVQHVACSLEEAQALLASLPVSLARRLYRQQAHRLRTALERTGTVVMLREQAC
jgi:Trk K+ transport system NAD-binding subunit